MNLILVRQKVTLNAKCSVCHGGPESIGHAFWGCRWAQKVWKLTNFENLVCSFRGDDITSFFVSTLESFDVSNLELFLVLVWEIWNHRNNVSTGNDKWTPKELVEWTGGFLDAYWRANPPRPMPPESRVPPTSEWQPLGPSMVNVCIDAAIDSRGEKLGPDVC